MRTGFPRNTSPAHLVPAIPPLSLTMLYKPRHNYPTQPRNYLHPASHMIVSQSLPSVSTANASDSMDADAHLNLHEPLRTLRTLRTLRALHSLLLLEVHQSFLSIHTILFHIICRAY